MIPVRATVLGLAIATILAGCVTTRVPKQPARAASGAPDETVSVDLPSGPVAAPAGANTNAKLSFAIRPLGAIPYDGITLPLTSPDGRYVAVQQGEQPDWAAVLAQVGAPVPLGTRLAVYDISTSPPREIPLSGGSEPLPRGLLLSRGTDDRGFLVESPQPTGARWIGRVGWKGGIEWLVRDDNVNAHATLLSSGVVAFSTRTSSGGPFHLALRGTGGGIRIIDRAEEVVFPLATSEPNLLGAMLLSPNGLEIAAFRVSGSPAAPDSVTLLSRRLISSNGDLPLAYQVTAPAQADTAARRPTEPQSKASRGILFFNPGAGRMAVFAPRSGSFELLPPKSIAATRHPRGDVDNPGYFATTPAGLVFSADPPGDEADPTRLRPPEVSVLGTPYVPRATTDPDRPLVLFGPARDAVTPRISIAIVAFQPAR
jgi:hypothetical protein